MVDLTSLLWTIGWGNWILYLGIPWRDGKGTWIIFLELKLWVWGTCSIYCVFCIDPGVLWNPVTTLAGDIKICGLVKELGVPKVKFAFGSLYAECWKIGGPGGTCSGIIARLVSIFMKCGFIFCRLSKLFIYYVEWNAIFLPTLELIVSF